MRSLNPWPIFPSNLEPPVARSLSIQFILQGLTDAFDLLERLKKITPVQLQGISLKEELTRLSKELEKFLLFSLENPFAQKTSAVDKLCFYCEILVQASHVNNNGILIILEEIRDAVLNMRSKMLGWKKVAVGVDSVLEQFEELYSVLFDQLCRFFTAFSLFLKEARFDENVLIYLIEHKEKLNTYLGERHIENLLQSFFPAGHKQLRAAIYEGYTRRGFTSFLSSIETEIDAIEWETSCHSPAAR